jgi:hypothetical protein
MLELANIDIRSADLQQKVQTDTSSVDKAASSASCSSTSSQRGRGKGRPASSVSSNWASNSTSAIKILPKQNPLSPSSLPVSKQHDLAQVENQQVDKVKGEAAVGETIPCQSSPVLADINSGKRSATHSDTPPSLPPQHIDIPSLSSPPGSNVPLLQLGNGMTFLSPASNFFLLGNRTGNAVPMLPAGSNLKFFGSPPQAFLTPTALTETSCSAVGASISGVAVASASSSVVTTFSSTTSTCSSVIRSQLQQQTANNESTPGTSSCGQSTSTSEATIGSKKRKKNENASGKFWIQAGPDVVQHALAAKVKLDKLALNAELQQQMEGLQSSLVTKNISDANKSSNSQTRNSENTLQSTDFTSRKIEVLASSETDTTTLPSPQKTSWCKTVTSKEASNKNADFQREQMSTETEFIRRKRKLKSSDKDTFNQQLEPEITGAKMCENRNTSQSVPSSCSESVGPRRSVRALSKPRPDYIALDGNLNEDMIEKSHWPLLLEDRGGAVPSDNKDKSVKAASSHSDLVEMKQEQADKDCDRRTDNVLQTSVRSLGKHSGCDVYIEREEEEMDDDNDHEHLMIDLSPKTDQQCAESSTNVQNMNEFLCRVCQETFSSQGDLDKHDVAEHNDTIGCEVCDSSFSTIQELLVHTRKEHAKWKGPVQG